MAVRIVLGPSQWSVADVGQWLRLIGLSKYVDAFAQKQVSGATLMDTANVAWSAGVSPDDIRTITEALQQAQAIAEPVAGEGGQNGLLLQPPDQQPQPNPDFQPPEDPRQRRKQCIILGCVVVALIIIVAPTLAAVIKAG